LAWLCLLVSASSVDLVDETYRIPGGEWRYVEVSLRQRPATIYAVLGSPESPPGIRAALLTHEDLYRLNRDRPYGVLATSSPGPVARLSFYVRNPGEYALVLDNRESDKPATVHLRVWLDFAGPPGHQPETLSPQRRMTVILVSFLGFFAIVTWSARRLLQSIRR